MVPLLQEIEYIRCHRHEGFLRMGTRWEREADELCFEHV